MDNNNRSPLPNTRQRTTSLFIAGYLLLSTSGFASNHFVFDDDPTALLGSSRGGLAIWDYCYGKSDTTPVPVDPRTLVQPGVNQGKAVHFNAFWKNCHTDPEAVQEVGTPATCGELRAQFYRGAALMDTGNPGVSALFAGSNYQSSEAVWGISVFPARQFNKLWKVWGGYSERPDNFDELVAQRYGSGMSDGRNPYPLPPTPYPRKILMQQQAEAVNYRKCSPNCACPTAVGAAKSASPVTAATAEPLARRNRVMTLALFLAGPAPPA